MHICSSNLDLSAVSTYPELQDPELQLNSSTLGEFPTPIDEQFSDDFIEIQYFSEREVSSKR